MSHLDYCSVVYLDVSGELQTKLQRLQNSCVRYITGVGRPEHITPHRLLQDWLDVKGRRAYFAAVFIYKAYYSGQPAYLSALFEKNHCRTSGRTSRDLTVPGARTDVGLTELLQSIWLASLESFHRGSALWPHCYGLRWLCVVTY